MVMAAFWGPGGLFLACALGAKGDPWGVPCEEQQRYRQNHSEPEVVWGSTVAILSIFGALMMLVQYVIRFINKDQCPQQRKDCETQRETQQVYVRQLVCMEQQLEALLYEVRSQKSTLKDTLTEKESLLNTTEKGSDKLRITVYEIADCEASGNPQPRGRKRQF
ncbi:UNVERIFIED_CONTAM: hypothetical protein K2H54_004467 [Gekko kuhli]